MKKSTTILLIILGLAIIGGGLWFYSSTKTEVNVSTDIFADVELQRVYKIKENAVKNINDFLKTPADPGSVWEDLLANEQFQNLEEFEVNINLEEVGNPEPFNVPPPENPEE